MNAYVVAFLVIPLFALVAREFFNIKVSLWIVFVVYVLVGWALVNLAVWSHFAGLEALVRSYASPPEQLLDELQGDGAKYVFAYYFGWAYAAIYFLLSLWLFYIGRYLKKRVWY